MIAKPAASRYSALIVLFASYILAVLWLGVIFSLSSQAATESNELSTGIAEKIVALVDQVVPQAELDARSLNPVVRKNAHFAAYLLLGGLIANGLHLSWRYARTSQLLAVAGNQHLSAWKRRLTSRLAAWPSRRVWLVAWLFCVLYAVTDEVHQHFVPGRGCQVQDVLIDSAGAAAGILLYQLIRQIAAKARQRWIVRRPV